MLPKLGRKVALHELSHYILTRGLALAAALLLSALALSVAGQGTWLAGWYSGYLQSGAAILAGTALLGSLLVEDVLRRCS